MLCNKMHNKLYIKYLFYNTYDIQTPTQFNSLENNTVRNYEIKFDRTKEKPLNTPNMRVTRN